MYKKQSNPLIRFVLGVVLTLVSLPAMAGSYEQVWSQVKSDPYTRMPQYQTTYSSLLSGFTNILEIAANRTLTSKTDLLPRFQKLVHPIGVCFSGTWKITENNSYSGYFSEGSEGLIIVRASEAMGNPNQGDFRAFGIAGKIFPTTDPNDAQNYRTANFFTVDDLGGTTATSFLDLEKSNEPAVSIHPTALLSFPLFLKIANTFKSADSNPGIRPLYEIAELGLSNPRSAKTPHWMILKAENNQRLGGVPADFRNELRLKNFKRGKLSFGIYVSDKGDSSSVRIGSIELNDEALSDSCDHRLHFGHPKDR